MTVYPDFSPGPHLDTGSSIMILDMLLRMIFKNLSMTKQADFMKRRGIVLGTRKKDGRQGYLYMVNNLFAEIIYENDNPQLGAERLIVLDGLQNLNNYLEKDLRS